MKAILYPFSPNEPSVQLTRDFSELDWTVAASPEDVARAAPGAAIYVTSNRTCKAATGEALRRHGDALRWMHFTSAGIDGGIAMGIPDGVVVTNSTGVRSGNVSEHALLLLLSLVRALPVWQARQRTHQWLRSETTPQVRSLQNAVVCILGQGSIGRELARKLKGLDACPIAVSRTLEPGEHVTQVFPRERLREALAMSDALAICTSGGDDTRQMIGAAELAALKAGAFVVNIARGSIIDETALVAALRSGHIGGAGLDVAQTEPLPAGHPLWDMPNVILSPHIAGAGSEGYLHQRKLFGENLRRFKTGEPLLNACTVPARA
ncbi:MAG: D-2-hydroxyacid dehydrogenase [Xanthobacteraceae bacterium]